jgi:hypothetical protein
MGVSDNKAVSFMRSLALLLLLCVWRVTADELSDRANIQTSIDTLNAAVPDPEFDPAVVPGIQQCLKENNDETPDHCVALIQKQYDFLLAKYKRQYATNMMVKLLAEGTPKQKVMQFTTPLVK